MHDGLEDLDLHEAQPLPIFDRQRIRVDQLKDLNLEVELLEQYNTAKDYLDDIPEGTPANQVAQVMNTITAILRDVVKMQTDLYNAERIKIMEDCIIQAMKGAPATVQDEFFEVYQRLLPTK